MNFAYIGTTSGNLYFYTMKDMALLGHSVQRDVHLPQLKHARICDIRAHPTKPHRLLLVYREVCVAVYTMNKHSFN